MHHFRFDTERAALAFSEAVDRAFGYPRAGVDVGSGVHAPTDLGVTGSYYPPPSKHPMLEQWSLPDADDVRDLIASDPQLSVEAVREIRDASWDPPVLPLFAAQSDPAVASTIVGRTFDAAAIVADAEAQAVSRSQSDDAAPVEVIVRSARRGETT